MKQYIDINSIIYQRKIVEPTQEGERPNLILVVKYQQDGHIHNYVGSLSNQFLLIRLKDCIKMVEVTSSKQEMVLYIADYYIADFNSPIPLENVPLIPICVLQKSQDKVLDLTTLHLISKMINLTDNCENSQSDLNQLLINLKITDKLLYQSCLSGDPHNIRKHIITILMRRRIRQIINGDEVWTFIIDEYNKYNNEELIAEYISAMKTRQIAQLLLPELEAYLDVLRCNNMLPVSEIQRLSILLIRLGKCKSFISRLMLST